MKKQNGRVHHDEWYAAAAIIVICAGFLAIGYVLGMINAQVLLIQTILIPRHGAAANTTSTTATAYTDTTAWEVSDNGTAHIRIAYPMDFSANDMYSAEPSADWGGSGMGTKIFTLTIPKVFQPQSNFNEAVLTIGKSGKSQAVADCLKADESTGEIAASAMKSINGVDYFVTHATDAGAGNLYDSASYRAVQNGACYVIKYVIHSSQLGNYPAEYKLHEFDKAAVESVLERIVGTVVFTK